MNVTNSKLANVGSWIMNSLRTQDGYTQSVNLSFNGNDTYKTALGGIASIIIIIKLGALAIAILLMISIFQRDNSTISVYKTFKDITNDQESHYFAK